MKNLNLYQQIILLTLTFFVLVVFMAIFHENGILTIHEFEKKMIKFNVNNITLKKTNQNLRFEIEALKSDPLSIEIIAREKLNMVLPGETVYQMVPLEKLFTSPPKTR